LKIREEKRQTRERAKAGDKADEVVARAAECLPEGEETEVGEGTLQSLLAKHGMDLDLEEPRSDSHQDKGQDGGPDMLPADDTFDPYAELLRSMTVPRDGNM